MARLAYLIPVLSKRLRGQDTCCPHCGSRDTTVVGRKHLLLQLRKCSSCRLLFRWPKDSPGDNHRFYSGLYREPNGLTTTPPSRDELARLTSSDFVGTDKDFSEHVTTLRRHGSHGKLLDYGASWGYGTWQFARAGFEAIGFEIDVQRAQYGRELLGLQMLTSSSELLQLPDASFDVIFTSHVLEHLPEITTTFEQFRRLLADDGVLFIVVPNCTGMETPHVFETKKTFAFGEKHAIAFTAEFFCRNLPAYGLEIECVSTSTLTDAHRKPQDAVDGFELRVLARKSKEPNTGSGSSHDQDSMTHREGRI